MLYKHRTSGVGRPISMLLKFALVFGDKKIEKYSHFSLYIEWYILVLRNHFFTIKDLYVYTQNKYTYKHTYRHDYVWANSGYIERYCVYVHVFY